MIKMVLLCNQTWYKDPYPAAYVRQDVCRGGLAMTPLVVMPDLIWHADKIKLDLP